MIVAVVVGMIVAVVGMIVAVVVGMIVAVVVGIRGITVIVKILNIYTMLSCTHL